MYVCMYVSNKINHMLYVNMLKRQYLVWVLDTYL
jgi:hypothetical protein